MRTNPDRFPSPVGNGAPLNGEQTLGNAAARLTVAEGAGKPGQPPRARAYSNAADAVSGGHADCVPGAGR